ncbi:MAG: N-acetylmuramoyl-L-alanine amidase [Arcobacteraceae bacterium]
MFISLNAATIDELKSQYSQLKIEYLKAVLKNDKVQETKNLEELVTLGSKIGENTSKYKDELTKIKQNQTQKTLVKATTPSVKETQKKEAPLPSKKELPKIETPKKQLPIIKSTFYSIDSVETQEDSIIINFNQDVSAKDIKFFELFADNLHKDVFDINGAFKDALSTKIAINNVKRIAIGQFKPDVLRISIAHDFNLKTIYIVNKKQIIIKILDLGLKEKVVSSLKTETFNKKKRTVVIDPGHGGKDAGGVGKNKRYEKVVTFKVSKYLHDILKERGYEVYLTRKSDIYVELKTRTKLSNDKNADIFVSIHTNAIGKEKADTQKGIETFFLSPARSDRAKRVAAAENKTDMDAMNNNSQMSFLTVLNQSKITASNKLAIDIQQNLLYGARQLHKDVVDGGVREGPFWVLVGAQMPSVLVELGYISHPEEAQRLFNPRYQKQLAKGLADGIDAYFSKNLY